MTKVVQKVVLKIAFAFAFLERFLCHGSAFCSIHTYIHTYIFYTYGWKLYFRQFYMFKESMASSSSKCILDRTGSSQSNLFKSRIKSSLPSPNSGKSQTELENAKKGNAKYGSTFHLDEIWHNTSDLMSASQSCVNRSPSPPPRLLR